MAIVDLSKFLPGGDLKKTYADPLIPISADGGLERISKVLQPVVIVDNVSSSTAGGPSSGAAQVGTFTVPSGGATGSGVPAQPTVLTQPQIGARVSSSLWTPVGFNSGGLQSKTFTATGSISLKYPPTGWGWDIRGVLVLWQTGASVAYDAAGTTPANFWVSPNAVDAMVAAADAGSASGDVSAWLVTPNGLIYGPKKSAAASPYATGTNYMGALGPSATTFNANILSATAMAMPEAYVNGGTWAQWWRDNGPLPLITANGGMGMTFRAGAAGQSVVVLAATVWFDWIWVGF